MTKNKKYLLIASYVILVSVIGVLVYLNFFKSDNNVKSDANKDSIVNETKANEYLKSVPFLDSTLFETVLDAYSGNNYTMDTVPKETLLSIALKAAEKRPFTEETKPKVKKSDCGEVADDECTGDEYFHKDDVNAALKKLFNIENIKVDKVSLPGGAAFYFEPYYVSFYGAGAGMITKFNSINSMTENNEEIIIEENACFLVQEMVDGKMYSSTNFENSSIHSFEIQDDDYQNDFKVLKDNAKEYYQKNKDKCKTFTHVFKTRPDGNPYWYSTKVNN